MQLALYIVVVFAGILVPFFIKEEMKIKEKLWHYLVVLADAVALGIMIYQNTCIIPGHGKLVCFSIGLLIIACGMTAAKLHRIVLKINPKTTTKQNKTAT